MTVAKYLDETGFIKGEREHHIVFVEKKIKRVDTECAEGSISLSQEISPLIYYKDEKAISEYAGCIVTSRYAIPAAFKDSISQNIPLPQLLRLFDYNPSGLFLGDMKEFDIDPVLLELFSRSEIISLGVISKKNLEQFAENTNKTEEILEKDL